MALDLVSTAFLYPIGSSQSTRSRPRKSYEWSIGTVHPFAMARARLDSAQHFDILVLKVFSSM